MISSSQNAKIKHVRALLGRAKERREADAFVIESVRLVEEAARVDWKFETVLFDKSLSERGRSQVEHLKSRRVEVEEVSESVMKSLSETETPQGILAVLKFTELPIPASPDFVLIPDQIRDPGNLGTLLRSAAAAGVQAVLLPPETTDAFAPKVVRAGMGAHFRIPIHEMNWDEIRNQLIDPHRPAYGGGTSPKSETDLGDVGGGRMQVLVADMAGKSCWETDLRQPLALIIGSEAEGASDEAKKLATNKISIPMAGNVESLNAGVAGSVLMFEVLRQRTDVG